eukprot:226201_1
MSTQSQTDSIIKSFRCRKLRKTILTTPICFYLMAIIFPLTYLIEFKGIPTTINNKSDKQKKNNKKKSHKILLPYEYQKCFELNESFIAPKQCKLPNNITIIIDKEIGHGEIGSVWQTKIYYSNINISSNNYNYDIYAMKYSIYCNGLSSEYKLLKHINKNNNNKTNMNINIPLLHPFIPFYYFYTNTTYDDRLCFIFMQYLQNTLTLEQFSKSNNILKSLSFNKISGGIISFILNCYSDII